MKPTSPVVLFLVLTMISPAVAQQADWAEGSSQHSDGANREHYNTGAILPWKYFMGDWRDAKDEEQGDAAYSLTKVVDTDTLKPIRWDVTTLVKEWTDGNHPNQVFFCELPTVVAQLCLRVARVRTRHFGPD